VRGLLAQFSSIESAELQQGLRIIEHVDDLAERRQRTVVVAQLLIEDPEVIDHLQSAVDMLRQSVAGNPRRERVTRLLKPPLILKLSGIDCPSLEIPRIEINRLATRVYSVVIPAQGQVEGDELLIDGSCLRIKLSCLFEKTRRLDEPIFVLAHQGKRIKLAGVDSSQLLASLRPQRNKR